MSKEKKFQDLKELIQDIYEFMDRQKLDDALAKLEKIRIEVVSHCCEIDREQLICKHSWVHNTHSDTKYCSKGCDGFAIHKAN